MVWAATLLVVAAICVSLVRRPLLSTVGGALVAEDAVERVDAVVMTTAVGEAGVLEVADLMRGRIAARAGILVGPAEAFQDEFARRGIPYEQPDARLFRLLVSAGVEPGAIERIPSDPGGTESESRTLVDWSRRRAYRSVMVVTTKDHSRRLRRTLRRMQVPGGT